MNKKSQDLHFRREGTNGRTEEARLRRVREGVTEGQRLVTGVRSRWGCASLLKRTNYHICQQFWFGRVSVNSSILFWTRHREILVFLQTPQRYQYGGTFRVHLDGHKMFKCTSYLRKTDTTGVVHRRSCGCARPARRKQLNITEAAPNELNLGG